MPDPKIFLWIVASAAGIAAFNLNSIKTVLANGISVLVNNNLCGKLIPSLESPTTLDRSFKVTSVSFLSLILIYYVVN